MTHIWDDAVKTDVAFLVLDNEYGVRPTSVAKLRRHSVNSVYLCRTGGDPSTDLILKRLGRSVSEAFLDFQDRALAEVASAGLPIPHPMPSASGARTVRAQGSAWQLASRLAGRTYTDGQLPAVRAVATCVNRLHDLTISSALPPADENPTRDIEQWLGTGSRELEELVEAISSAPVVNHDLRQYRAALTPVVDRALSELDGASYATLPHSLTHGELTGSNILVSEDGTVVKGLLDWDGVFIRPRVYDLARGSLFLARQRRDGFQIHHDLVTEFLRLATGNRPLSDAELRALIPILELLLVGTARHFRTMCRDSPGGLNWWLRWSTSGATQVRTIMGPALDAYRSGLADSQSR